MIVVDVSFVVKLLKREASADILGKEELITARLFDYEFTNVIWKASKFSNLEETDAKRFFEAAEKLNIERRSVNSEELFHLSCETGLTAYDASYLALALKNRCSLATFDKELAQKAKQKFVRVVF